MIVGLKETKPSCKRSPTDRFFSNDISEESEAFVEEDEELELFWTSASKVQLSSKLEPDLKLEWLPVFVVQIGSMLVSSLLLVWFKSRSSSHDFAVRIPKLDVLIASSGTALVIHRVMFCESL